MPDLQSLLPRAASLAPEWCEYIIPGHPEATRYLLNSVGHFVYPELTITDSDRALILYAVLRECERRGLGFGVSCTDGAWNGYIFPEPPQDPMEPWVAIYKNDSDPAVAILSAFVAYLETEVKAEPFGASE